METIIRAKGGHNDQEAQLFQGIIY